MCISQLLRNCSQHGNQQMEYDCQTSEGEAGMHVPYGYNGGYIPLRGGQAGLERFQDTETNRLGNGITATAYRQFSVDIVGMPLHCAG